MVRLSMLHLAAIATLLLGAEAGPCKPKPTTTTSLAETTSTLPADTSATSIASTIVVTTADTTTTIPEETTTTALADTTTTDKAESTTTVETGSTTVTEAESTTTALVDTTTTQAESTTTTAAAGCVESQLFVNPNFDDSSSGIEPWISNAVLTQNQPQSGTNALAATFSNGQPDYSIKQTLQNLSGNYKFSYYYRVVSVSQNADYTCNIQLTAGSVSSYGEIDDRVGGWKTASVILEMGDATIAQADVQFGLSCYGEFTGIEVDVDTFAFTRVCAE
ncbi:uncharacterized protein FFB20_12022 [Fusarium fujikuroi]|nr:Uncharacterized protein Y057_9264 [Fusarium fujikuroi]SCN87735.1 uncharacterized protein FFC1_05259 [Fusarium fujikuroi]SCN92372.1 uncharacterized protein FFE2_07352 [Fusarium fujikuroi]SCO03905.1 uncharacterized protein FFB20_12022 [Fusarium fujikuroi]SCO42956.1 uncharacterized protein FFMR_07116 [Fusarium fujikuroi]